MSAIEFLKEKGILLKDNTHWFIHWEDGRKVDLVELFEEYGRRKDKTKYPVAPDDRVSKSGSRWLIWLFVLFALAVIGLFATILICKL